MRARFQQLHQLVALALLVPLSSGVSGCNNGSAPFRPNFVPPAPVFSNPTDITNPYLPLGALTQDVLEGTEGPDSVRVVRARLGTTKAFVVEGQPVDAMIVVDSDFVAGVLTEVTLDYFAQADDGTVYYFGEDVDVYANGQVVSHGGAWLYGVQTTTLGILVPGQPEIGQTFRGEDVPGVTRENDEIQSVTATVTVPAGTYTNCLKIKESSGGEVEYKYYAATVGVIDEVTPDGRVSLISHQ